MRRIRVAKTRTMVVEDEAMIALDLQNILKNLGYDVSDRARSGVKALALTTAKRSELASHGYSHQRADRRGGDRAGMGF